VNGLTGTLPPPKTSVPDLVEPSITAATAPATPDPLTTVTGAPEMTPSTHPYRYTYVTDELCAGWESGGREEMLRQAQEALQEPDEVKLILIMQELVQSALSGRVSPSDAGDVVQHVVESERGSGPDQEPRPAQTAVLDSVSISFEKNPSERLDRLSAFLIATGIPQELLRHELDATLLEKLDLIRSTFNRMGIRKQTNLLYRQANFNLMREESEGFAKLMTELFTTSGNEPPSGDVVEDTVEKVKAMIGAFDLDVGRSLDVVLDVFGAVLVKQFRFFVKFLRASPWWPRQGESARRRTATGGLPLWALPGCPEWHLMEEQAHTVAEEARSRDEAFWPQARQLGLRAFFRLGLSPASPEAVEQAGRSTREDDWPSRWIRETGTMPPSGNRDAAQLLGFKLRFYSSSAARDETDVLPDNLIYLSALLIKIGFISLIDLYPHIWRPDEAMDDFKQQKLKEKAERERAARPGWGTKNALLMAGALADDTLAIPSRLRESSTRAGTPSKDSEPEKPANHKESSAEPADQKVLLLKSLLAIGALPEALFILGRFPWLIDLIPELPEFLNRILHHCVSQVYGDLRPLQHRPTLHEQKPGYETDVPGVPKGHVKVVETTERKVLRWALLDRSDSSDGTDYRFYWDEWNDNIPVCHTVDDVFTLCDTLLALVGVKIGHDPGLVLKITRIGKHSLHVDRSEANRERWLDVSKRLLLPSLSLTKSNAGVVNEVFELISNFSISTRYLMYLEWTSGGTSQNPDIKLAFDQARAETKDILKRISNTNVRPMARALAKVAYANPHIVITTALAQIEVYDSIAEVFVEGARYFTDLAYDVLTWAMVSSMARAGRSRTQEGGIFTSRWLSALAHFAGKIYKRYSMMRPGPVLQYVAEQLEKGNTTDLKMLEQIVVSMAGIATDTSYNDTQLQAMGGGPLLQSQTILQLLDRRHDSKKTSERLMKALHDNGLASRFLISMAQQRQACVFVDGDIPLKAIGNTFDEIHRVMAQYLDLLRTNWTDEEFRAAVPDVVSLMIDYQIRPEIAFWISRPLIAKRMSEYDKDHAENRRTEDAGDVVKEVNGDVDMSDHVNAASEEDGEAVDDEEEADTDTAEINGTDLALDPADHHKPLTPTATPDEVWHPVMQDLMDAIQPRLPNDVVDVIGTGFYTTFWQLSLYDITIPGKSYEDELSRQHKKIAAISADRSDVSVSGSRRKEAAKKEITELIDRLLAENKQHLKAFAESKARLQREKDQWFAGKARMNEQLNTALMEHCFLPRILASPLDAYFCFKFIKFLHNAGTPNFRTLGLYDLFFRPFRLASLIFMCTSKEADNLGRFLNEVLKDLARWHGSEATYEREGWGTKKNLPGFAMKVENGKVVTRLEFETFRRVLYKWHGHFYTALQKCLTSSEYMHVRNAISVLRAVSGVYPAVNVHGTGLQKSVDKLRDSDKEDLKVASQALLGALHRREKSWVILHAFRQGLEKATDAEARTAPPSAPDSVENQEPAKGIRGEEDGEVKDTVMTDVDTKPAPVPASTPAPATTAAPSASPHTKEDKKDVPKLVPRETATEPRGPPRPRSANGSATPVRSGDSTPMADKRESRGGRQEPAKPASLPRRISPPPRHQSTANLPSRLDVLDSRNGHRETARISTRPLSDLSRPGLDSRPSHGRDIRSGYRGAEPPPYEEYERHSRRHDRPDGLSSHPLRDDRDDRGYSREHERSHAYDRSRPAERERQPLPGRPPPPSLPPKDRDNREALTRGRQPPSEATLEEFPSQPAPASRRPPPHPSPSGAINPERAALISNSAEPRPTASIRGQAQERPRSSRPSSPRREDDRRVSHGHERDDRGGLPPDRRSDMPPTRQGLSTSSPAGPGSRSGPPGSFTRDSRGPLNQSSVDMQHGRLEQDASHRPPPRSDRPSEADVPSGPRGRTSAPGTRARGGPPLNAQIHSPSYPDRQTPAGPSARHSRHNSYHESTVGAPGNTPDTTGIHPSRLNQIEPASNESSRPATAHAATPTAPAPAPTAPTLQSNPPAGPRGNAPAGAPSGPSPASRAPPGDGVGRGGRNNRHPLTAVNNTLAQAGQGTSIRGRGGMRQNSGAFAPHMPPPGPSQRGSDGYLPPQDLFGPSSNPNGVSASARPPLSRHDSSRDRRSDVDERENERRSSTRHSSRHDETRGERDSHRTEREGRGDGKEDRGMDPAIRRDDRQSRREEPQSDDRRGYRSGPREDLPSRKHARAEEGAPYSGGSGGRGGSRTASESKRVRRGGSMV